MNKIKLMLLLGLLCCFSIHGYENQTDNDFVFDAKIVSQLHPNKQQDFDPEISVSATSCFNLTSREGTIVSPLVLAANSTQQIIFKNIITDQTFSEFGVSDNGRIDISVRVGNSSGEPNGTIKIDTIVNRNNTDYTINTTSASIGPGITSITANTSFVGQPNDIIKFKVTSNVETLIFAGPGTRQQLLQICTTTGCNP